MKIVGFILLTFSLGASELIVNTSSGEDYYLEIGPEDSFEAVLNTLQVLEGEATCAICLNLFDNKFEAKIKSTPTASRNYYQALTAKDEETIHELLTTLAYQNLIRIGAKRSSITKTGDQIQHLHPLKFLQHVFSNDELLVAIRNIRNRMIWGEFIDPIYASLQKEANMGNITPDQIQDFAKKVKLNEILITTYIQAQHWSGLIETLLTQVPRSNDAKRYDM